MFMSNSCHILEIIALFIIIHVCIIIKVTLIYQIFLHSAIFKGEPDCVYFKEQCQELCLIQSGGVSSAQCWGDPLYCYCKASDGTVFHIEGFVCEHPDCPPDAI